MTCGIYCITNNINGKKYVGQSVNIEDRFEQHIYSKSNSEIHEAIEEFGVSNFTFEVLIACSPQELDMQEVKFIRLLGTYENGYNQTRGGQHHVFNVEHDYVKLSELKDEIKSNKKLIKSLKRKNKQLDNKLVKITSELESINIKNESLSNRIEMYKQTVEKYRLTQNILKRQITILKSSDNVDVESEIVELRLENERLRNKLKNNSESSTSNIFEDILYGNKAELSE